MTIYILVLSVNTNVLMTLEISFFFGSVNCSYLTLYNDQIFFPFYFFLKLELTNDYWYMCIIPYLVHPTTFSSKNLIQGPQSLVARTLHREDLLEHISRKWNGLTFRRCSDLKCIMAVETYITISLSMQNNHVIKSVFFLR